MSQIRVAHLYAYYLFDVAETIDLDAIAALSGGAAVAARLSPKPATPPYVQYEKPPLSFDGDVVDRSAAVDGFRTRFRVYDYGVISIALSRPFSGSWADLVSVAQTLVESPVLEQQAETLCRGIAGRFRPALVSYRERFLAEDYLVCVVNELEQPLTAQQLVDEHGDDIAAILRGERQALSEQEKTAILRHRISYLADDLVIPTWNAAFVYDTPGGAQAALEILEFANSQLLELRYYDELLDDQLASIYARLQRPKWYEEWIGSGYARTARQVHSLFIDINELADRTENALKFIGDIYAARLFSLVADRLALGTWKTNVRQKLTTLGEISRFTVEQSSISRGQFLEFTIVLILILELVLVFMGVTK